MTKVIYVPTKAEFDRFQEDFGSIVTSSVYEDFIVYTIYLGNDTIVVITEVINIESLVEYQELGYEIITY